VQGLAGRGRARRTALAWFFLGALPFLASIVFFKVWLLQTAAPVSFLSWDAVRAQLFDPIRYRRVVLAVAATATAATPAPLAALAWGVLCGRSADAEVRGLGRTGISILTLMLAAFFAVYVVTPHDLGWHVSTTLDRLLTQIAPLTAFTVVLWAAVPGEGRRVTSVSPAARAERPAARRRRGQAAARRRRA
jgi:hypothetical protein